MGQLDLWRRRHWDAGGCGAGTSLTITFNASATSAAIDALIQNLTFANASDTPTVSRDLDVNMIDAAGRNLGGPAFVTAIFSTTPLSGAANPFDGIDVGDFGTPSFADLDGDGDLDLVAGWRDGTLRTWRNGGDGGSGRFAELSGAANPFASVAVDYASAPSFADLGGDGDLDLVVGDSPGTLSSYENTTPRGVTITVNVNAENDGPVG